MADLEKTIRDLAERGEITHLSLVPRGKGWSATFATAGTFETVFVEGSDPIETLMDALTKPKLKRRAPTKKQEAIASEDDLPDPLA